MDNVVVKSVSFVGLNCIFVCHARVMIIKCPLLICYLLFELIFLKLLVWYEYFLF